MTDFYDWSQVAASNDFADTTINWGENQDPDTVNNSARAMMARLAMFRDDLAPARSTTGTGNAYVVTSAGGGTGAYRNNEVIAFIADRANTGASTLNVNSRGGVPLRPAVAIDLRANEIQANQPVLAFYRSSTNEFLALGTGFHVDAMTNGLLVQSVVARLPRIGQPTLSIDPTVATGYIRLTEATQTLNKSDWPELSSWLSTRSTPYPWGSASLTFNLPPAAGYLLRFAGLTTTIDPSGPRAAGSTQADSVKTHTHSVTGTTDSQGAHTHNVGTGSSSFTPNSGTNVEAGNSSNASGVPTTSNGAHTHAVTGTAAAASDAATETMGKNVAIHLEILASTSLTAGTLASFGFPFAWDTGTTSADPGTARVRCNNATMASATSVYISETDAWGANIAPVIASVAIGTVLKLSKVGAQANYLLVRATAGSSDNGAFDTIACTVIGSNGTFSSNDTLALEIIGTPGTIGATGPAGGGIPWTWDAGVTAADPGAGKIRGDNATIASITNFYINNADANAATETTWLDGLDDSTSTVKGYIQLVKSSSPANTHTFRVNSVTGSAFRTISVTYIGGSGTFVAADSIALLQSRTGDLGAAGTNGLNGVNAGFAYAFATSATMADPSAGNVRFNNATLASATAIAISVNTADTGNPSIAASIAGWDGSTTATNRGRLLIKKLSAPQNFAEYTITAASTNNTTWYQLTVAYVSGAGTFSASDAVSIEFRRTGDAGANGSGTGTVTSVALALPATFSVSGSPITGSGTLTAAYATQLANLIFAGPNTGGAAAPTFRALVSADIPALSYAPATSGSAVQKANGSGGLTAATAGTDYLAPPAGASIQKANAGGALIAATAGTDFLAPPSGTAVLKANSSGALANAVAGTDYLDKGTTSLITVGYTITPFSIGTISSGTTTPAAASGNYQYMTNNGAFTLAAPAADSAIDLLVTNGASAGAITFSGFTVSASTGDALTTTNTNKFIISIRRINATATYVIKALQ